jgi:regulator of cell morphogenesis and NO signaling
MIASPRDSLADLAVRSPAASRVFKRYGLDYCCHGERTLEGACRARNLDPAVVLAELEREARERFARGARQ